ncbi:MAG TPA: serine/threonine-protein kinase [Polyangiaceae bacterium]|nr:serine/threonine-protein kinase [Polyangiaceae bacterium]
MAASTVDDPFAWTGATVDGKYRVDAVVGEGGFGVVYRAYHLGFGEKVAIKCLRIPPTLVGGERDRFFSSFLAEGRLLHQLSKSTAGIVQALDVGGAISPNKAWTPYLVMEWLEGRTLEFDFAERKALGIGGRPLLEAIEQLDSAARAMAMAHEQGVAHRDIKPANLFLADVGGRRTLKVLDFGIAKVITETASMTRAFEATGSSLQAFTPRYGAPEQFSRRFGATGPWTDVFSFALVLVEAVSGRGALEGTDASQLFVSSADAQRRPTLRTVGVDATDAVEDVLRTALAVDPKERHANAGEFWEALIAAAASSLGESERMPVPRSLQASSPALQAALDANLPRPRLIQPSSPATQLTTSRQVDGDFVRPSLNPRTRPTPARVAIAVTAAAALFSLVALLGGLVWQGGEPHPARSRALPSATPIASIEPPPADPKEEPAPPPERASTLAPEPPPPVSADIPAPPPPAPETPEMAFPSPPGAAALDVSEGRVAGTDVWFGAFRVLPRSGGANKTFVEAHVSCAEAGMALCTEMQWARACGLYPSIAASSAWTLTADPNGFVVRGGGDCAQRGVSAGGERNPARGTVCCDRSVGINSSNKNTSFLMATAKRVLDIEKTLNQRNVAGFLDLLTDPIGIDRLSKPKSAVSKLLAAAFEQWPDQWLVSDVCGVTMHNTTVVRRTRRGRVQRKVTGDSWSATCEQVRFRGGEIAVIDATYTFGGVGKVKSIVDGEVKRPWSRP